MRHSLIFLVGFMGSGKSTVGRALAQELGLDFVDLDREIEKRQGRAIRDIFRESGEAAFRQAESEELARVSARSDAVVALGGGAFCSEDNRRIIAGRGVSVWLDAPLDVLAARCGGDPARPLFAALEEAARLLETRRTHYRLAEFRADAAAPVPAVVAEIVGFLT